MKSVSFYRKVVAPNRVGGKYLSSALLKSQCPPSLLDPLLILPSVDTTLIDVTDANVVVIAISVVVKSCTFIAIIITLHVVCHCNSDVMMLFSCRNGHGIIIPFLMFLFEDVTC